MEGWKNEWREDEVTKVKEEAYYVDLFHVISRTVSEYWGRILQPSAGFGT